ncbi:MAG TPA: helix-turn-helix domain-containing protein [Alphaproteobacteria bacterium]|nr:helix-turn-helix domain-containing protein [Alphaproteobacteria bacterium]
MTQAYAVKGKKIASKPYHYTQCGLDDVYLLNGVKRHKTPYGSGVAIEKVEELHEAIAHYMCLNKALLNGKEFRFLRKLMDLTQSDVATYMGCDVQSVARWEKGKTEINGAADKLLRLLYLGSRHYDIQACDLIKKLAELDTKVIERQVFTETPDGWKAAA